MSLSAAPGADIGVASTPDHKPAPEWVVAVGLGAIAPGLGKAVPGLGRAVPGLCGTALCPPGLGRTPPGLYWVAAGLAKDEVAEPVS